MGPERNRNSLPNSSSRTSAPSTTPPPQLRRPPSSSSSTALPSSSTSSRISPKVQLIPHLRTASFDVALTETQRALLDGTSFDHLDLSSQDFEFEDIFTYDKPQRKLPKVIEVTGTTRARDWSNFSFSHYTAAQATRAKVNRNRSGISEQYLKHQVAHTSIKRV